MSESQVKQQGSKTSTANKTNAVGSTTAAASASTVGDSKGTLGKTSSMTMSKRKTSFKNVQRLKSIKSFGHRSMSRMKVRKQSYGFSGVSGIRLASQSSTANVEYKRPPLLFFPTYQLESSQPFNIPLVQEEVQDVIEKSFLGHKYNIQESPALALAMSQEVMRRVKGLSFNRYRIFAVVTIGQRRAQSYYNAVAFLWDCQRDSYVNAQAEVNTAFVQVTVFGIYLD